MTILRHTRHYDGSNAAIWKWRDTRAIGAPGDATKMAFWHGYIEVAESHGDKEESLTVQHKNDCML